uniref:SUN domain-containing protein n=1 Tax=Panagrolaimus sp. ES5 TaxID=591445 RepID=A0AC34FB12_9BILA
MPYSIHFLGAVIDSHSETYDPKTNILYFSGIPIVYLPPNEPDLLLQRPIGNLTINDCWLMKGSEGYVEIKLHQAVKVHHLDYHHFNQTELYDSMPKIIIVEGITSNTTVLLGKFEDFGNVTQRIVHSNHTVVSHVRLRILENYGNPIYTSLCRFQLFGEEEVSQEKKSA